MDVNTSSFRLEYKYFNPITMFDQVAIPHLSSVCFTEMSLLFAHASLCESIVHDKPGTKTLWLVVIQAFLRLVEKPKPMTCLDVSPKASNFTRPS